MSNNINLFGKLGAAWMHHTLNNAGTFTGTHSRLALYGGVGGSVAASQNWALTVQINATSKGGNMPAMILTSIGLTVAV